MNILCVIKERVSYDQLSVTQWVACFCRIMKEEKIVVLGNICLITSLAYMIMLMIFHGMRQRPAILSSYAGWNKRRYPIIVKLRKSTESGKKSLRSMTGNFFNLGTCSHKKHTKLEGYYTNTCAQHVLQWVNLSITQRLHVDQKIKSLQKQIDPGEQNNRFMSGNGSIFLCSN